MERKRKLQRNEENENSGRKVMKSKPAVKEKERLKTFNQALEKLQSVIPVKLPEGRKLHKKQTLQVSISNLREGGTRKKMFNCPDVV